MKNFDSVHDLERKNAAVRNDDGIVSSAGKPRGEGLGVNSSAAIALLPVAPLVGRALRNIRGALGRASRRCPFCFMSSDDEAAGDRRSTEPRYFSSGKFFRHCFLP